jgi:hypothetical protein
MLPCTAYLRFSDPQTALAAAFYAYAAPVPEGPEKAGARGRAMFDRNLGEFILGYDDARAAADPVEAVLEFLEQRYSGATDAAQWDRRSLDRTDEVASAVRLKNPRHGGPTQVPASGFSDRQRGEMP